MFGHFAQVCFLGVATFLLGLQLSIPRADFEDLEVDLDTEQCFFSPPRFLNFLALVSMPRHLFYEKHHERHFLHAFSQSKNGRTHPLITRSIISMVVWHWVLARPPQEVESKA